MKAHTRAAVAKQVRGLGKLLAGRVADPTGAAKRVVRKGAEKALELIRLAFEVRSKGDRDETGLKWVPLKPATLKAKKKAGEPSSILVRSGSLMDSLGLGSKATALSVIQEKPGKIVLGTDIPYAAHHHYGTRSLPKRPLWPDPAKWPASWWQRIADAMAKQLSAELSAAGYKATYTK